MIQRRGKTQSGIKVNREPGLKPNWNTRVPIEMNQVCESAVVPKMEFDSALAKLVHAYICTQHMWAILLALYNGLHRFHVAWHPKVLYSEIIFDQHVASLGVRLSIV